MVAMVDLLKAALASKMVIAKMLRHHYYYFSYLV